MHELGHTLNLGHGGGDHTNYKPNYLGIMNYLFQFADDVVDRPLDYSRWELPPGGTPALNEAALREDLGIDNLAPPADLSTRFPHTAYTYYDDPSDTCRFRVASTVGDIDWDNDGAISSVTPVQAGINDPDGNPDFGFDEACESSQSEALTSYNDWENIDLNFRDNDAFAAGAHGAASTDPESTPERVLEHASLSDWDEDGVSNLDDNCTAWPNPGQSLPPWPVPTDDPDCDGSATSDEEHMGTLPLQHCPQTGEANGVDDDGDTSVDEVGEGGGDEEPDAWPPDADDNQVVNVGDLIILFGGGKMLVDDQDPLYSARSDFDADGDLDVGDLINAFFDTILTTCVP